MGDISALRRADVLFKFVELALSAVCIGLVSGRASGLNGHKIELVGGTYIGFTILGSVIVLSYFLDSPLNKKVLMLVAVLGAVLFITAGSFNIEAYRTYKDDKVLGGGVAALVNGVVYLVDVFLSYRS